MTSILLALALAQAAVPADSPPVPEDRDEVRRARRVRFAGAAVYDMVGGGSKRGNWAGLVHGGWPWGGM